MKEKYVKISFHVFIVLILVLPMMYQEGSFSLDRRLLPVITMIPFYFINISYLIPKYLQNGRYLHYALSVVAGYLLFLLVNRLGFYVAETFGFLEMPPQPFDPERMEGHEGRGPRPPGGGGERHFFFGFFFVLHFLLVILLGICFEMILEWENQKRKYQETQKEKVSAELGFLKSQINPHFLFNTLNNIYSLAAAKSDDTEEAILLLSNMMRYVLYESGTDKISLDKEIDFIQNFIALQKIRLSSKKAISITFDVSGERRNLKIEPMLFLPIVENAFKHGISYKESSFVHIYLDVHDRELMFSVKNSKPSQEVKPKIGEEKNSGIGLENIRKRLLLLYPHQHEFKIQDDQESYLVELKLNVSV